MSWKDDLSEELAASPTLADVEDVESLASQFIEQASYLGNSIRVPGEDADAEALATFRKKLMDHSTGLMEIPNPEDDAAMQAVFASMGRPEKAGEYAKAEGMDDKRFELLSEVAFESGISRRQFDKMVGKVMEADAALIDTASNEREGGLAKLRDDWGQAYDAKLAKAAKLAELTDAPAGLVKAVAAGQVDADTLRWLDKLGTSLGGETAEMIQQHSGDSTAMTKAEAGERANEIYQTMIKMPSGDPRYNELMEKRVKYIGIATSS